MKRALRGGAWALAWLLALGYVVWAFGALYLDFPLLNAVVAWAFALAVLVVIIFAHGARRKLGATFFGFALVLAWWITLKAQQRSQTGSPTWRSSARQRSKATKSRCAMSATCDYRTEADYTAALGHAHRATGSIRSFVFRAGLLFFV